MTGVRRNRLADETSPYLLQHADNPVDWYPWGEEAFARARELDRPLLLSIGYAACHWCHVMAHESFENAALAAAINEHFVPVKVDREERPDVDALYMQAVVSLTGGGGWPMTVFLTPDAKPFYGGTYFPPEPRHGLPSFRQVLTGVEAAYRDQREGVDRQAEALVEALRTRPQPAREGELRESVLTDSLLVLRGQFDDRQGGFGGAPKFPPHALLTFLLRMHRRTGSEEALRMACLTLDRMAAGGIHDQLGGGFHRYAVDGIWLVPHFEKMLYDNALLARAYLAAHQITGDARYAEVATATLDYLLSELRLAHGGFASAEDADTDGVEGFTYVWTETELEHLLGDEARLVVELYGVTEAGNFEGATVLSQVCSLDEAAERSGVDAGALPRLRARLLEERRRRPQPARDDKALAAWNGMALAALAEGARVLDRDDYLTAARACAEFLLGPLSQGDGRLWRTHRLGDSRIDAFLDDYAQVATGLYELYLASREPGWLAEARRLALLAVERFADSNDGGFFETSNDGEQLIARPKELDDTPTPSGSATLAGLLVRLGRIDGRDVAIEEATGTVRLALPHLPRAAQAFGGLLGVLDSLLSSPRELAIVGPPDDPAMAELAAAGLARWDPDLAVAYSDGETDDPKLVAGRRAIEGRATAYVCRGFACEAPLSDPDALRAALEA